MPSEDLPFAHVKEHGSDGQQKDEDEDVVRGRRRLLVFLLDLVLNCRGILLVSEYGL